MPDNEFGRLLTEAIWRIRLRENKPLQIVQDELGYALGRHGGHTAIEYWRQGHIPAEPASVAQLAREVVRRGRLDREWLEKLLGCAGYSQPEVLCNELFPMFDPSASPTLLTKQTPLASDDLSPFVVGPPITHPRQFFGRERELSSIFNTFKRRPLQNVALIGPKRSGKTSLLHYLKNIVAAAPTALRPGQRQAWLAQPETYRWIFVDFHDAHLCRREGLLTYLAAELEMQWPSGVPSDLYGFMEIVRTQELRQPTIILLDEIGTALASPELDQQFWESLRAFGTSYADGKLSFVVAGHTSPAQLAYAHGNTSPFFNIFFPTLQLGPLTEAEARALVESSPQPFELAEVEWILTQSGRWPYLLQILCQTYLSAQEEGRPAAGWRAEGLRLIAPHQHLLVE